MPKGEVIPLTPPALVEVEYKGQVFHVLAQPGQDPETLAALAGSGYPMPGVGVGYHASMTNSPSTLELHDLTTKKGVFVPKTITSGRSTLTGCLWPGIGDKKLMPLMVADPSTGGSRWGGVLAWCGEVYKTLECPGPECTYEKDIKWSCGRRECPDCWPTPVAKTSEEIAKKIFELRTLAMIWWKPREVILVPPVPWAPMRPDEVEELWRGHEMVPPGLSWEDLPTDEVLTRLFQISRTTLETMGAFAFTVSPHFFHIKKERQRELNDEASKKHRGRDGRKLNKYDILRDRINAGEPRDLYEDPYVHTHAITLGSIDVDKLPPGWFVKVNTKKIKTVDDLSHKLFYILSHAAVIEGRRSIREYGLLRKMNEVKRWHEPVETMCPECRQYQLVDKLTKEPAFHRDLHVIYEWNDRALAERELWRGHEMPGRWKKPPGDIRAVLTAPPPGGGGALAPSPGGASEGGGIP